MKSTAFLNILSLRRRSDDRRGENRETWRGSLQFMCCCIVATVGMQNVWEFPYVALSNGRGTFLLCYLCVVLLMGIPLNYLEVVLGQFSSKPNSRVYKMLAPGFAGIAWCQSIIAASVSAYLGTIVAYSFFYFTQSFSAALPWTECREGLTNQCISFVNASNTYKNVNFSEELFFHQEVLRVKSQIVNVVALPHGTVIMCSLFAWALNFIILSSGVKWIGNASYILAIFPYFILITLLGRITRLPGANVGINYFFQTNWTSALQPKVWSAAIMQCLMSLGQGTGTITMLASYNKFGCSSRRISLFVVLIDTAISLVFGVSAFAVLGHISAKLNMTMEDLPNRGPELVFVSYAQVLSSMTSMPNVLTAFFFFMLFLISLGSLQGLQLVITNHIRSHVPDLKDSYLACASSTCCCILSITYITSGGLYLMEMVNTFVISIALVLVITVILMVVVFVYGLQHISWDIEYMTQSEFRFFSRMLWGIVDALMLIFVLINYFSTVEPFRRGVYVYPLIYQIFGWIVVILTVCPIPLILVFSLVGESHRGWTEAFRRTLTPVNWRPYKFEHYDEWKQLKLTITRKIAELNDTPSVKFVKSMLRMYD